MHRPSRRDFLKSSLAATAFAGLPVSLRPQTGKRSATDWVTLGKSGVKVTRLAFGTGTFSGRVQRELGQEGFTSLIRYAYDHGIRFFETAESYHGMPEMLGIALKGIPRDTYRIMTKYSTPRPTYEAKATIDQYRQQMNTDYLDILLLHCVRKPTWPEDFARPADDFSELKSKKVILAQGASVHGLPPLRTFPGNKWLDVAMIRMNHAGSHMDTEDARDTPAKGDVNEVVANMKKVHAQGTGTISMKLVGEGSFTSREERQASLKFAMNIGCVDSVTIGFKNTAEIDEAIENLNLALNG
ncbi:MAG TPA: aldo/keto reductase [Bryobacteraceae bacterium]|nr:aldo/keto reductase [Bryobacteraceae bacterium]